MIIEDRAEWYFGSRLGLAFEPCSNCTCFACVRDENGTDIFRSYSKPNPFIEVEICPYPSPDIQHPIPYPYPNTQIAYL